MAEEARWADERQAGDEALFRALYLPLRRFAAAVGPRELEPDDLVQEAVTRTLAHQRLSELHDPEPYLRRVIVNLATTGFRRRRPWLRAQATVAESTSTWQPMPSDLGDLDRLTPVDRAVMWLVHVEGHSHREAAELLGITEQASRSRSARARQQLARTLAAEDSTS